ncbi:MAG TPA: bifunctional phosphoribosylaminoimidazolecarboxamide formyltransferase/IMP cyclohydrolase [Acidimicrobiales bacterium]|jgi:phosphoribosylaminoimidazolecarboxamide formyltransferase / IMP cyclohydrolase|nr:bifunctional phosphoribosylaminoimidazolecarboxamide formyltransferase/IMP cyclohydrolase [Acidimicrobiales bacterium]
MSRRALLSVYDKTGVVELARGLADAGWELVSSGGTARALSEAGLPVTDLAEFTGYPPMLGHRVVTLHPLIHGAILADRDDPEHQADIDTYGIKPVDLVVANLYPFGSDPSEFQHGGGRGEDLIDIGGPAMTRAAAKNHAHVGIVVDPADYDAVLDEIRSNGSLSATTRRALARKAFATTAAYDAAVVSWFDSDSDEKLPPTIHLALERVQDLRYGENPHQVGARYRTMRTTSWWDEIEQHFGMALSYLNLYDADAAWSMAHDIGQSRPCVTIIKHANPSGLAVDDDLAEAYQRALECDERSAFGGIVALNRIVDADTVERIVAGPQADVIIAPGYAEGVVDALRKKRKNTRVLSAPAPTPDPLQLRQISGGMLVQDAHHFASTRADWRVVTKRQPTEDEWRDAEFAFRVCGWVKSNAIILAKDETAWGIGAGQQNRVESGQIAAAKAAGRAKGGACASDAFYPFPDGVEAAASAEVAVVIQPGGAMNDQAVIDTADELGLAMIFTGERHFLH